MGLLPKPAVPLTDICSVIFNNTLYTYSADAFQALPLTPGGEWKQLPQGEKVTGGVCVGSTPGDASKAALFVVGGKAGREGYHGVQKYTYSTGRWESVTLPQPVTQDRLWHGATYINSTDSILVYAGSQDGSKHPSSQTFTIGASAPYTVLAFESAAPPTINPILLPWSPSQAALIGGNTWNNKIMLFSHEAKWVESGASLVEPMMKDTSAVKAVIMTGDDGSKSLYTFDMTASPNIVKRTVLLTGPGTPVQNSKPVKREASSLTVGAWPEYNATLVPTTTRSGFSLAQGPDGLVVAAGGNDEDILCMFDARENAWRNATAVFAQAQLFVSESSSTLSSSVTASATSTLLSTGAVAGAATSTAAAGAATYTPSGTPTNTILAAVLGSIFGLAMVLFGLYICVQKKRRQQAHMEAGHARRASGVSSDEKSGIGYASNSYPHAPGGAGTFRGHQAQDSHASFSSMAILMGRINQQKPAVHSPPSRNTSQNSKRGSTDSAFKALKSTISKPIPQSTPTVMTSRAPLPATAMRDEKGASPYPDTAEPRPRSPSAVAAIDQQGGVRRSSGWNRYWSGGSALGLLGFGGGNGGGNGGSNGVSKRGTVASEASSQYSSTAHRITQDSATVPPLQIYEPRASFSRVISRSPTIAQYDERLREGLRGQIETQRPVSGVSSASGYSSGIPASVHEAWDPTADNKPWGSDRPQHGVFHNPSTYATPLAPASQGSRQPSTLAPQQRQPQQPVTRDDMSWLNLGGN